jgi:hypothetical protein
MPTTYVAATNGCSSDFVTHHPSSVVESQRFARAVAPMTDVENSLNLVCDLR